MEKRALHCISIYLPMDKKGKEQNMHLAQASLKQSINKVKVTLTEHQMHKDEIANYLKPVVQLLDQVELWRNPSEGLVIFLDPEEGMRLYQVPIAFKAKTYVSSRFYLNPLLALYHNNGRYYLLELSQDYIRLYKASRYGFKDMNIEDFAPNRLEEAVGFDYKPKMLQFRSGQNVHGAGVFHGHGEGKDDHRKELLTFFKAVDQGVKKAISDKSAPLVLACVDYLFDLYKQASTYTELYQENIGGDPEFKVKTSLHQASWDLMEPHFAKPLAEKLTQFKELYHTQKTSYEIDEIINAALNGKVDTLFIENDIDLFGIYDIESNKVTIDDQQETYNTSLTNLAALETFRQGGQAYFLNSEEMPVTGSSMNALFRF